MKQTLFLLIAATVTACAQTVPEGEFRLAGNIENLPDSAVLCLYETQGSLSRTIAADTLRDGTFSFRDTVSVPKAVQISLRVGDYHGGTLDVWVAPGKCVRIRGKSPEAWTWEVVSGIPEQQDEDACRALVEPEIRALNRFQNVLNTPEEVARYMELFGQMSAKTVRWMQTTPVTKVWINKLAECARLLQHGIGTDCLDEMLTLYDRLPEEWRLSRTGRVVGGYLRPASTVGVGDLLADGDLYDVDGGRHRLSEFIGKYILLDFWSRGCGPCLQAIPELREVAERYADRVEVVSISQDPEHVWKAYVAAQKLTGNQWNELLDANTGLGARYRVTGIPHFVLIAPDGRIQDVWTGYGKGSLLEKIEENIV